MALFGVWFWAYGFGRMVLGVWFRFGRRAFSRRVLGAGLLAYGFGGMVLLWAYGFGRMALGV